MTDVNTPEELFSRYRGDIAKELSKGFTSDQIELWITHACNTLCKGQSISFMVKFAKLLRHAITEVEIAQSSPNPNIDSTDTRNRFDPFQWKTVKILRSDWKLIQKCIVRYEKQLGRELCIKEID